jgi:polysaccharide export outer membrane protein
MTATSAPRLFNAIHAITIALVGAVLTIAMAAAVSASDWPQPEDKKQPPQPPALGDEYRLGPGDKLRIEVYKDPQLSQSVQIRPDGKITLPLVGDVDATGRTPLELRDMLAKSLKEFMNNPTVTVIVVEAVASQVFVMGEVSHPGSMQLHGPTTILQAIAMAGGFKEFANTKDVRVLRPNPNGSMQQLRFNYKDVLNGEAKPFYLRSGDTVIVP